MSTTACLKKLRDCQLIAQRYREDGDMIGSECALLDGIAAAIGDATVPVRAIIPLVDDLKRFHPESLESPAVKCLIGLRREMT